MNRSFWGELRETALTFLLVWLAKMELAEHRSLERVEAFDAYVAAVERDVTREAKTARWRRSR